MKFAFYSAIDDVTKNSGKTRKNEIRFILILTVFIFLVAFFRFL